MSRADAAKIRGMDRQTLGDWVHRFNDEGPEGLINRKGPERGRRLTQAQMRELAELVETGPDRIVLPRHGSSQRKVQTLVPGFQCCGQTAPVQ